MDDTRDVYKEFIDNDGPIDNPKFLDDLVAASPGPSPVLPPM